MANGGSGALSFVTMVGLAGVLNRPILKSVNAITAENKIGNSLLAKIVRHEAVSSRLSGIASGVAVGAPAGFVAAESNAFFRHGQLANKDTLVDSVAASTIIGGGFGAFNKIKSPEIARKKYVAHNGVIVENLDGIRREIGPTPYALQPGDTLVHVEPLFKIGSFACYRGADIVRLEKSVQHWKKESSIDALTNLPNNKAGEIVLKQNFQSAKRNNSPLSLVFMDLDGFKAVNDHVGHNQGDLVLQEVAKKLQSQCRGQDTIYRKGGDEFVAILPETDYQGAKKIAEQIQDTIKLEVEHPDKTRTLKVGTSVGTYTYEPGKGCIQSIEDLIKAADELMYKNKHARKSSKAYYISEYLHR